jgi:two-component system C4-dicarboxylate transport response regulator DctD
MNEGQVLLVEDDDDLRPALAEGLEIEGFNVSSFKRAGDALGKINNRFDGVVVSDIKMPKMDGMTLLSSVLEIDAALPVILVTGHADVPLAVDAMRSGAYDFLEKPFPVSKLADIVRRGCEKRRLVLENRALRETLPASESLSDQLVGNSPAMRKLRAEVQAVAGSNADVLVTAETGAGKEVVSRAIHQAGDRSDKPFVALNCAALPAELIESELFGHRKGAFTGANEDRVGKIEYANGGTILLDEIESMPIDLQAKLLRVLEERSVERLGTNKPIKVDVRFIAATKDDLEKASKEKRFRADLFYRLNVVSLSIQPLRERKDDIPELFFHLCRLARARYRKEIPDIPPSLIAELRKKEWPGNVRELRNYADRFVLGLLGSDRGEASAAEQEPHDLASAVSAYERDLIREALKRYDGKMKPTYEALGISRKTLYDKIQKYGLNELEID